VGGGGGGGGGGGRGGGGGGCWLGGEVLLLVGLGVGGETGAAPSDESKKGLQV